MHEAIVFDTDPSRYRHWSFETERAIATVTLRVDPKGSLRGDYELKLNSYDLGVDIELHDITQRLRFEHPEVKAVLLTGGLERVFCAGANIQMLAGSSHTEKVNFCKFTNETRMAIEDASAHSGQPWIAVVNGTAAGGGYELALACEEIVLVDDRASAVSLPEIPLLGVLPGTGGLTRLVDKRHVRRDLADLFVTRPEGVKGDQALEWGLVDAIAPPSRLGEVARQHAEEQAARSDRPAGVSGIPLPPLEVAVSADSLHYSSLEAEIDRSLGAAFLTIKGPAGAQPGNPEELVRDGASAWVLAVARELDDAVLRLRFNEPDVGTWVLRTSGDAERVLEAESVLAEHGGHWLAREIRLQQARTLRRLDVSSRSLIALVEPGSCFAGVLAELVLAADRAMMLEGSRYEGEAPATLRISAANDGWFPMSNGLSRLATRFWGRDEALEFARATVGKELLAAEAAEAGLVTTTPDDIDWDDDVRIALEERHSFSPDALTAMEANLRFVGPETIETKIFARLSAWQNWVFQRPNAVGPDGALRSYGTGTRPSFERTRT